jgi:hypothetical protein
VIIDTGILLAAADRSDEHNRAAAGILSLPGPKVIPGPVVAEADYLMLTRLGVEVEIAFLESLEGGALAVEEMRADDRARALELVTTYRDAEIGYVDASVMALAERLGERRIATLDRRDFSLVKPRHAPAFELVP